MCSVTGLWHTEGLQKHLLIVVPLNHNVLVSKEADRVSETARSWEVGSHNNGVYGQDYIKGTLCKMY